MLWQALRRRRFDGHKFRRQRPIGDFIVDFVCLEQRLIIEVDGAGHLRRTDRDASRDEWLRGNGFRVLRFWNSEVLMQLDSVEQAIWAALEEARTSTDPLPHPPPSGGGEDSRAERSTEGVE